MTDAVATAALQSPKVRAPRGPKSSTGPVRSPLSPHTKNICKVLHLYLQAILQFREAMHSNKEAMLRGQPHSIWVMGVAETRLQWPDLEHPLGGLGRQELQQE